MKIAFFISSRLGHTQKIARVIAHEIKNKRAHAEIDFFNLEKLDFEINLECYHLIIIGASIRYGHFHKNLKHFTNEYAEILNRKNTAFYAINLVARKLEKCTPEKNSYTRKFLIKTQWHPKLIAVFAGVLNYPCYSFFDKQVIRLIMKLTGGETDMRKCVEYTDWKQVSQFAHSLLECI